MEKSGDLGTNVLYVDASSEDGFTTIQDAINAADYGEKPKFTKEQRAEIHQIVSTDSITLGLP